MIEKTRYKCLPELEKIKNIPKENIVRIAPWNKEDTKSALESIMTSYKCKLTDKQTEKVH